ncbi:MAG: molybdopterin-guanine dinucleotide biosynthesis protein B [Rhodobacteraceae bacterium]|nr:molybdopterin-guanine dinucleotide biosynthesis protein B [Paracoccaceae bacterium]
MNLWGVTGWKDTGKTGLMERLVAEFSARGLKVSTIKRAHHGFDVDQPGKDSHRHRVAGAQEVLLSSANRWTLMAELRGAGEPVLDHLLSRLSPVDLVLAEGFKRDCHPKIETHRSAAGHSLLATGNPTIRAVASDSVLTLDRPVFHLNDTIGIANFIATELGL